MARRTTRREPDTGARPVELGPGGYFGPGCGADLGAHRPGRPAPVTRSTPSGPSSTPRPMRRARSSSRGTRTTVAATPSCFGRAAFGLVADGRRRSWSRPDPGHRTRSLSARSPWAGPTPTWTPSADLAALAEAAWGDRVRANRDQVDRVREVPDGTDFYAPVRSMFRADPTRTDDPVLAALLGLVAGWRDVAGRRGRGRSLRAADRPGARAVGWDRHRAGRLGLDARGRPGDRGRPRHREPAHDRGPLADG